MALIKFGSIVTSGSGSLGGHTIQRSKGGTQLRNKPSSSKVPSPAQYTIRRFISILQGVWRNLSEENRELWHVYATANPVYMHLNSGIPLSAHSLFMQINFGQLQADEDIILNPYGTSEELLGAELIVNGSFNGSSDWVNQGGWLYGLNTYDYLAVVNGTLRQTRNTFQAVLYRFVFEISNATGPVSLVIRNSENRIMFDEPTLEPFTGSNGIHTFATSAPEISTNIKFSAFASGSSFSLDNVSVKPIL